MLRKPKVVSFANARARGFAGARWLSFAARIRANYGSFNKRRGGLLLHWLRHPSRSITFQNRWLLSALFPRYQLHLSNPLYFGDVFHSQKDSAAPPKYAAAPGGGMQRFIHNHFSLALRSIRVLESKSLHTAVRTVVREKHSVEHHFAAQPLQVQATNAASSPVAPGPSVLTIARQAETRRNAVQDELQKVPRFPSAISTEMDVNRIADQVIRQMDHRIAAWRERRGRG
jgi:hypothetical protein